MADSNQFSPQDEPFTDLEIAIEFQPVNEQAAELLRQQLANAEILESNAFTGTEILTVIVL
ncbi:hypothetical protein GCM10027347_61730 [Larkinella harenae]